VRGRGNAAGHDGGREIAPGVAGFGHTILEPFERGVGGNGITNA
jgi:hypothetical protein